MDAPGVKGPKGPTGDLSDLATGGDQGSTGITGGAGDVGSTSDRRFKENLRVIDSALEKVLKMRGVEYYWRALVNGKPTPNKMAKHKIKRGNSKSKGTLIIIIEKYFIITELSIL